MNAAKRDNAGLIALGRAVEDRISWLGWTYQEVQDRGGLGRAALRELINGRRAPRMRSLSELDDILGWPKDTAVGVLQERITAPTSDMWPEGPNQYKIGVLRSGLMKLSRDHDQISHQVQTNAETLREYIAVLDELRRDKN